MYGQSTYCLANSRFVSIDSRVSSGLPTIRPPTTNRPCRWRCSMASMVALPPLRPSPRRAFFARALTKSSALHQRRERLAMLGKRRRHRLHEIFDIVEPGADNGLAQLREAADVE